MVHFREPSVVAHAQSQTGQVLRPSPKSRMSEPDVEASSPCAPASRACRRRRLRRGGYFAHPFG